MASSLPLNGPVSLLAGIGFICQQWALIEQLLLGIIAAAENTPLERVYTRHGTTDMMPRIRMAIRLAEEAKWPRNLQTRLKDVRRALQSEGPKGLIEQRNLFVHGAHKVGLNPGEVELTMARWAKNDRDHIVTALDAAKLGFRLSELAQDVHAIFRDYARWKFQSKFDDDGGQQFAQTKTRTRLMRAQNIKRAIKSLWANLKG